MANTYSAVLPPDEIYTGQAPEVAAPSPVAVVNAPVIPNSLRREAPSPAFQPQKIDRPAPVYREERQPSVFDRPPPRGVGRVMPSTAPPSYTPSLSPSATDLANQRAQDSYHRRLEADRIREANRAGKELQREQAAATKQSYGIAEDIYKVQNPGAKTEKITGGVVVPKPNLFTGEQDRNVIKDEVRYDGAGRPYQTVLDETGAVKVLNPEKDAKVVANKDDPEDTGVYFENKASPWTRVEPEQALFHPDKRVGDLYSAQQRKRALTELADKKRELESSRVHSYDVLGGKDRKSVRDGSYTPFNDDDRGRAERTKEQMDVEDQIASIAKDQARIKGMSIADYRNELTGKVNPDEQAAIKSKIVEDKLNSTSLVEKELDGEQQKLENDRKRLLAQRQQPMNDQDRFMHEQAVASLGVRVAAWGARKNGLQKELADTESEANSIVPNVDMKPAPVSQDAVNEVSNEPHVLLGETVKLNDDAKQFASDRDAFEKEADAKKAGVSTISDEIAFNTWYNQNRAGMQKRAVDIENRGKVVNQASERAQILHEDSQIEALTKSPFHAGIAPEVRDIKMAFRRDSAGLPDDKKQKLADIADKKVAEAIGKGDQKQREVFDLIDAHGHALNWWSQIQPEPNDEPSDLQRKQEVVVNGEIARRKKLKPESEMTPAEKEAESLRRRKPLEAQEEISQGEKEKWAKLTGVPYELVDKSVTDYEKASFRGIYKDGRAHQLSNGKYVINPSVMWDSAQMTSESNSKTGQDKAAFDISLYNERKNPANQADIKRAMTKSFPDAWPAYVQAHSSEYLPDVIEHFRQQEGLDGNKFARLLNPFAWGSFAGTREKAWQAFQTAGSGVDAGLMGLASMATADIPGLGENMASGARLMSRAYEGEAQELAGMNSAAADLTKMSFEMLPFMKVGALVGMGARMAGIGESVAAAKALPIMGRVTAMGEAAAAKGASTAGEYAAAMVESGMAPKMAQAAGRGFQTLMETQNAAPLMKMIMAGVDVPVIHQVSSFAMMASMTAGSTMNSATQAYTAQAMQSLLAGKDLSKMSPQEMDEIKAKAETIGTAGGRNVAMLSGVLGGIVVLAFPKGQESLMKKMISMPKEAVNMTAADFVAEAGEKTIMDVIHSGSMKEGVKAFLRMSADTGKIMAPHIIDQAAEMIVFTVSQELLAKATYNPNITVGEIVHSAVESAGMGALMGVMPGMVESFSRGRSIDKFRKDNGGEAKGGDATAPDEPITPQTPDEIKTAVDDLEKLHGSISTEALMAGHEGHAGAFPELKSIDADIAAKRKAVEVAPDGEAKDAAMAGLHEALLTRSDALDRMAGIVHDGDPEAAKSEVDAEQARNPANAAKLAAAIKMQEHGWDGLLKGEQDVLLAKSEGVEPAVDKTGDTPVFRQEFLNRVSQAKGDDGAALYPETSRILPTSELAQRAVHGHEMTAKPAGEEPKPKEEAPKPEKAPVEHPEDVKAAITEIRGGDKTILDDKEQGDVAEALGHVREAIARFQPAFGDAKPVFTMEPKQTAGFSVHDGRLVVSVPDILHTAKNLKKGASTKQWADLVMREEGIHKIVEDFSRTAEGEKLFDSITKHLSEDAAWKKVMDQLYPNAKDNDVTHEFLAALIAGKIQINKGKWTVDGKELRQEELFNNRGLVAEVKNALRAIVKYLKGMMKGKNPEFDAAVQKMVDTVTARIEELDDIAVPKKAKEAPAPEVTPEAALKNDKAPNWMDEQSAQLSANVPDKTRKAILDLAAERKTTSEIAKALGIDADIVRAIKYVEGVPSWTTGMNRGGDAVEDADFTAWKTRYEAKTNEQPEPSLREQDKPSEFTVQDTPDNGGNNGEVQGTGPQNEPASEGGTRRAESARGDRLGGEQETNGGVDQKPLTEEERADKISILEDMIAMKKETGKDYQHLVNALVELQGGQKFKESEIAANIIQGHPQFDTAHKELENLIPIKISKPSDLDAKIKRAHALFSKLNGDVSQTRYESTNGRTPAIKKKAILKLRSMSREIDMVTILRGEILPELDRLYREAKTNEQPEPDKLAGTMAERAAESPAPKAETTTPTETTTNGIETQEKDGQGQVSNEQLLEKYPPSSEQSGLGAGAATTPEMEPLKVTTPKGDSSSVEKHLASFDYLTGAGRDYDAVALGLSRDDVAEAAQYIPSHFNGGSGATFAWMYGWKEGKNGTRNPADRGLGGGIQNAIIQGNKAYDDMFGIKDSAKDKDYFDKGIKPKKIDARIVPSAPAAGEQSPVAEPSVAKEPWAMTWTEFRGRQIEGQPEYISRNSGAMRMDKELHTELIRDALSEGKPVPSEVLADYPDLVKPSTPEPSVAATKERKAMAENKAPIPQKIIEALLRSGHELVPTGDSNSGFRQMLMQVLTGQKTPKAKSGVNAVEKALFDYLGVEKNHYAGMRDGAKEKLRTMLAVKESPTNEVVPQKDGDVSDKPAETSGERFSVYPYKDKFLVQQTDKRQIFGDQIFNTREEAEKQAATDKRIDESNKEYRAKQEARKQDEADALAAKQKPVNDYLDSLGLNPMQRGKAFTVLDKQVVKNTEKKTYTGSRFDVVKQMVDDGYNPMSEEVDAIQEPSRTQRNRMDNRQQAAFDKKKLAAGKKTEYRMDNGDGFFVVTKAEHDLAEYFRKKKEPKQAEPSEAAPISPKVEQTGTPALEATGELGGTSASPQVSTFSPDDNLIMHSPYTGEDTTVSYRGDYEGKAVIWTGKTQMSVPKEWLRRKGEKRTGPTLEKETAKTEAQISEVSIPAQTEAQELPFPKGKKAMALELVGPKPTDYVRIKTWEKQLAAILTNTSAKLEEMVTDSRAFDKKHKALAAKTRKNFAPIESLIASSPEHWRKAFSSLAQANGIEGYVTMPDNSKGDETYRLAKHLAELGVDLSKQPVEPSEAPTPAANAEPEATARDASRPEQMTPRVDLILNSPLRDVSGAKARLEELRSKVSAEQPAYTELRVKADSLRKSRKKSDQRELGFIEEALKRIKEKTQPWTDEMNRLSTQISNAENIAIANDPSKTLSQRFEARTQTGNPITSEEINVLKDAVKSEAAAKIRSEFPDVTEKEVSSLVGRASEIDRGLFTWGALLRGLRQAEVSESSKGYSGFSSFKLGDDIRGDYDKLFSQSKDTPPPTREVTDKLSDAVSDWVENDKAENQKMLDEKRKADDEKVKEAQTVAAEILSRPVIPGSAGELEGGKKLSTAFIPQRAPIVPLDTPDFKPLKPKDAIKALYPITSDDANRYVLHGVFITEVKGRMVAVATDGRRLIVTPYAGDLKPDTIYSAGRVKPSQKNPKAIAEGGVIDGNFPNFQQVIPEKGNMAIPLTSEMFQLLRQLERANKIIEGKGYTASFRLASGDYITFDSSFLLSEIKALQQAGYPEITMRFKDAMSPVVLETSDPQALGVLMPMRIEGGAKEEPMHHLLLGDLRKPDAYSKPIKSQQVPDSENQIVYHQSSSSEPITSFKDSPHALHYFSTTKNVLDKMIKAGASKDSSRPTQRIAATLDYSNPLDLRSAQNSADTPAQWMDAFEKAGITIPDRLRDKVSNNPTKNATPAWAFINVGGAELKQAIRDAGYDAVKFNEWGGVTTGVLDSDQIKIKRGAKDTQKPQQAPDADVARHSELEAKHNAGTITPAETAEAQKLVDAAAKAYAMGKLSKKPDSVQRMFSNRYAERRYKRWKAFDPSERTSTELQKLEKFVKSRLGIDVNLSDAPLPLANATRWVDAVAGTHPEIAPWLRLAQLNQRSNSAMNEVVEGDTLSIAGTASEAAPKFGEPGWGDLTVSMRNKARAESDERSALLSRLSESTKGVYSTQEILSIADAIRDGFSMAIFHNREPGRAAEEGFAKLYEQLNGIRIDPFTGTPLYQRFAPESNDIRRSQPNEQRHTQADINERREAAGEKPYEKGPPRGWAQVEASAKAKLAENPRLGVELAAKFTYGKDTVSDEEHFILGLDYERIQKEMARNHDILADSNGENTPAVKQAERDLERLDQEQMLNQSAAFYGHGSNAGRALNARKAAFEANYSQGAMMRKIEASMRRRLDPADPKDKEIIRKITEETKRHAEASKAKQKLEDERDKLDSTKAAENAHADGLEEAAKAGMDDASPEVNSFVKRMVEKFTSRSKAVFSSLKARFGVKDDSIKSRPVNNIDYEIVDAATILRAQGADSIEAIREGFVRELGEDIVKTHIDQHMSGLWEATNAHMDATAEKELGNAPAATKKQVKARIKKTDEPSAIISNVIERMKVKAGEGKSIRDLDTYTKKVGIQLIRSGIKGREELFDAIHEAVKEVFPDVSRQDVVESFSGYGGRKPLTEDPDLLHAMDMAAQGRELSKLDDILVKARAHQVSGIERKAPDPETRRLIKLAKKTIRENPDLYKGSAEGAGRSVEQSIATRLLNEIEEMDEAIANGKPMVSKDGKREYSPENKALLDRRNAKRKEYEENFKDVIGANRAEKALAFVEKEIAKVKNQIETGNIWPERPDAKEKPTSKEIEVKRTELDTLTKERDALRAADTAHRDEVRLKQLQRVGEQYAKRIAKMDETGQSDRQGKEPRPMTPAEVSLRESNKRAQRQIRELQDKLDPFIVEASIKAAQARLASSMAKVDARTALLSKELERIKAAKATGKPLSRAEIEAGQESLAELLSLVAKTGDEAKLKAIVDGNPDTIKEMTDTLKAKAAAKEKVGMDTRIQEAQLKVRQSEIALKKMQIDLEDASRGAGDKFGRFLADLNRANILSGPGVIAHLGGAGVAGIITSHLRTIPVAGARLLGKLIPGLGINQFLDMAPQAGHASWAAEAAMYRGNAKAGGELAPGGLFTGPTRRSTVQKITKGFGAADALHGGEKFMPHGGRHKPTGVGDFVKMTMASVSAVHGAMKEGPRMAHFGKALTAEWASAENASRKAGDPSMDPSVNPLVRQAVGVRALVQANREIMMGDNALSRLTVKAMQGAMRKDLVSPGLAKFLSNTIDLLLPVKKVPENILFRTLSYAIGTPVAAGNLILKGLQGKLKGFKEGKARITEREVEFIVENARNGMLGLGVLLAAWAKPEAFGGVFVPGPDKRKKSTLKYGDIDFGELLGMENSAVLNHQFAHDPLMMMANEVAQLRKHLDASYAETGDMREAYASSATMAPLVLLAGEPIYNMFSHMTSPYTTAPEKGASVVANLLTNKLVEAAFAYGDKDEYGEPIKREAKTLSDKLKVGWGFRDSVAAKQDGLSIEAMAPGYNKLKDGSVPEWVKASVEWNKNVEKLRNDGKLPPGDNWKMFIPEKADNYIPSTSDRDKVVLSREMRDKRTEKAKDYMNTLMGTFKPSGNALADMNRIRENHAKAQKQATADIKRELMLR